MKKLSAHLQPGFLTNESDFVAQLDKDSSFKPFGEMIRSYKVSKGTYALHFFFRDACL